MKELTIRDVLHVVSCWITGHTPRFIRSTPPIDTAEHEALKEEILKLHKENKKYGESVGISGDESGAAWVFGSNGKVIRDRRKSNFKN